MKRDRWSGTICLLAGARVLSEVRSSVRLRTETGHIGGQLCKIPTDSVIRLQLVLKV